MIKFFTFFIFTLIVLSLKIYSQNPNDSLVAYWSFDDSTAKDFSGNGYNGTIVNNPRPVPGVKGTAFHFQGKGYYMRNDADPSNIGDHILLPAIDFTQFSAFTISLWVKEEEMSWANSGEGYIWFGHHEYGWIGIQNHIDYNLYPSVDTALYLHFSVGESNFSNEIETRFDYSFRNRWVFYCMVYDSGKLKVYINGRLAGEKELGVISVQNTASLCRHWWIYSGEERTAARFTGCMDEVKIYKRALKEEEIQEEYNSIDCDGRFYYTETFRNADSLFLNGSAQVNNNALVLTPASPYLAGSAWFKEKVNVSDCFDVQFSFRISGGREGGIPDGSLPGSDGLAFVIQNSRNNAIGGYGVGLGYEGIENCLAVEFDTYQNNFISPSRNDCNGNHVGVQISKDQPISAYHGQPYMMVECPGIPRIKSDGSQIYYVKIDYNKAGSKYLRFFMDTTGKFLAPIFVYPSSGFNNILNLDNGKAWIGFTAGTGSGYEKHEILSFSVCSCQPFRDSNQVVLLASDITICEDEPIKLNDENNDGFIDVDSCQWKVDKLDISNTALVNKLNAELSVFTNRNNPVINHSTKSMSGTYIGNGIDKNGVKFRKTIIVKINPKPLPSITADNMISCNEIILTCSDTSKWMPDVTCRWSTGETTKKIKVNKPGNNKYKVYLTSDKGCTDSAEITVTIFEGLKPAIIADTTKSCSEIILIASDTSEGKPKVDFKWSTGETGNKITVNKPGRNRIRVFLKSETGCVDSAEIIVTINYKPKPVIISDKLISCSEITLTASDTSVWKPKVDYKWSTGESGNIIKVNKPGTNTYKVYLTTDESCLDSAEISVTIHDIPDINIVASRSLSICRGDSVVLIASRPFTRYRWSTGDTISKITVRNAGDYTLTVTDSNGCRNTATVTVKVFDLPVVSIKGDKIKTLCEGDSILLEADSDPSNILVWSNGLQSNSIFVKSPGKYAVTAINENGCRDSASVEVIVTPAITAEIAANGNTAFCHGDSVILSAMPKGNGIKYLWSAGQTSPDITVKEKGTYRVAVYTGGNCSDTAEIYVNVFPKPDVKITGNEYLCIGETETLTTGDSYQKYLWSTGDTIKEIGISKGGVYTVSVIDSNGCNGSAAIYVKESVINITGLSDLDLGRICTGKESSKDEIIKNSGAETAVIKNIRLVNNISPFTCTLVKNVIDPGEEIRIKVNFKPNEPAYYKDTLVVEFSQPCYAIYKAEIKGIGTAGTRADLTEIIASIGDTITIPLAIHLICGEPIKKTEEYQTDIIYDATALLPVNSLNTNITDKGISGGERILSVKGAGLDSVFISGIVMLSANDTTILRIDNFKWNNNYIENENRDGKLIIKGLCRHNLSRIEMISGLVLSVQPTPAGDEAEIKLQGERNGKISVCIYSLEGIKTVSFEIDKNTWETSQKIDLREFGDGLYQIIAKIDGDIIVDKILVMKGK